MPIYGYQCSQCGHELEVLQSVKDEPLRVCPECMGPLRKQLFPVGVIFKGSGFYSTDYKAKGESNGSSPSASGSDGGAGGDSKPTASKGESAGAKESSTPKAD